VAKLPSAIIAAAGIAAGAAFVVMAQKPAQGPAESDLQAAAAVLDGSIAETAAGVHSRAATLAEMPRLQAAVATDAATVRDLTQDELAFRPRGGEMIIIGQIPKGAGPVVLLEIPSGAKIPAPLDGEGIHLDVDGAQLTLTERIRVKPRERADEVTGILAVASPIDLAGATTRLDQLGVGGRVELGGKTLAVGKGAAPAADGLSLPLSKYPQAHLVVPKPVPAQSSLPLEGAGAGVALISLVVAAILLRRKEPGAVSVAEPSVTVTVDVPGTDVSVTAAPTIPAAAAQASGGARQIGRFEIVRPLGHGGMAEVFLARAVGAAGFEKLVALKVMHRQFALQPIIVEHFLDEARLASNLTHPNIVQVVELGKAGDEYFIAMEYIDGADLSRLLRSCRRREVKVPVRVAIAILRHICDGLHAAHTGVDKNGKALDIVHRDVKAANVFIARNGSVKIGDFGIAKANQLGRTTKTEVGQVKGTVAYMAPEHRVGETVDRRADVYALGAVAYEMLTGTKIDLDLVRLVHLGKEGWPHLPPMISVRKDLPVGLDPLVMRALAFDRDARFPTCAAMEEALEQIATVHNLVAGDKVIAHWAEEVLDLLSREPSHDVEVSR
jgi:serine/threonine-protein kinase